MLRVVADTNIYISALNFGGMPERLLRLAEAGAVRLVTSDAILEEVAKVLRDEKFAWAEERIAEAVQELRSRPNASSRRTGSTSFPPTLPTTASWKSHG